MLPPRIFHNKRCPKSTLWVDGLHKGDEHGAKVLLNKVELVHTQPTPRARCHLLRICPNWDSRDFGDVDEHFMDFPDVLHQKYVPTFIINVHKCYNPKFRNFLRSTESAESKTWQILGQITSYEEF